MTIKDRKLLEIVQRRNGMAKGSWAKSNGRIIFTEIKSESNLQGNKGKA